MDAVTVIGGGGGAGATTVVAELALALAALGRRVAAVDADLGIGDLDARLGIVATPSLADVIAGHCTLADALRMTTDGLRAVAAGGFAEPARALSPHECLRLIEEFDATGQRIDVLLLDAGTGVDPNTLFFAGVAQRIVLVTTPAVEAHHKAVAVLSAISSKLPKASVHVLVNRSRTASDGQQAFAALACSSEPTLCVDLHYLGAFPFDGRTDEAPGRDIPRGHGRMPAVRHAAEATAVRLLRASAGAPQLTGGPCLLAR